MHTIYSIICSLPLSPEHRMEIGEMIIYSSNIIVSQAIYILDRFERYVFIILINNSFNNNNNSFDFYTTLWRPGVTQSVDRPTERTNRDMFSFPIVNRAMLCSAAIGISIYRRRSVPFHSRFLMFLFIYMQRS